MKLKVKQMKNLKNKNTMKSILLIVSFFFIAEYGFCQGPAITNNENLGFIASTMISANQYGGQYSPMLFYKKNRRTYAIGPVIQNQRMNFSGVQLDYKYTIVGVDVPGDEPYNENIELFCFVTAAYYNNALLGKRAVWEEHMANEGYEGDVCKLRLKSVEVFGGAGLKIKLFKNIKWVNSVGLGSSTAFHLPHHLYHEAINTGVILRTGISIDIKK
jgi:hypothetical protein